MHTTLSLYGFRLRDAISSGNVNAEFVGDMLVPEGASAANTVTWVESHDNYCNNASYAELDEQQVIQAWAILASRKEGTPLFFSRPDGSSASNPWGNNVIGPEGSHFFMDSQVVAVVYNSRVDSPLQFEPEITLSVPTGDFLTDSLDVSVSIRGVGHATYKVDDGEEIAVSSGDVITVGEGLHADESVTLTVLGYNAAGEKIA